MDGQEEEEEEGPGLRQEDDDRGDYDEPDTQEDLTQSQNELTQLAPPFSDSQDNLTQLSPNCTQTTPSSANGSNTSRRVRSPSPPAINWRTVPWARLIPCSRFGRGSCEVGRGASTSTAPASTAAGAASSSGASSGRDGGGGGGGGGDSNSVGRHMYSAPPYVARDNGAGGIDLLPRDPLLDGGGTSTSAKSGGGGDSGGGNAAATAGATGAGGGGGGEGGGGGARGANANANANAGASTSSSSSTFMGLTNLHPSDRFNEFVLGRSAKNDVVMKKVPTEDVVDAVEPSAAAGNGDQTADESAQESAAQAAAKRNKNADWVHAMISNKHCRLYCHLKSKVGCGGSGSMCGGNIGGGNGGNGGNGNNNVGNYDMEVYIEDTSGNGTTINNTTLLSRNERRLLHTGDEICLLNPATLRRRVRSSREQEDLVRHYSFIFVNLYTQQQQQQQQQQTMAGGRSRGVGGGCVGGVGGGAASSSSSSGNLCTPIPAGGRTGGSRSTAESAACSASAFASAAAPAAAAAAAAPHTTSSAKRRRGLVDVRKIKTSQASQDDTDRAAMPPPTSSGGKFFSKVMRQADEGRMRQQQQQQQQQQRGGEEERRRLGQAAVKRANAQQRQRQQQQQQQQPRQRRVQDYYDIRDLLGSGTCGEVRRCINRRSGQQYAVKIIPTAPRGGGRMSAMKLQMSDAAVKAEAAILQALDHPYIVKLVDAFVVPNHAIYLVMEMLQGGDLFDRIVEKEQYTETEARRIMRRILAAVHYLHEVKDIVHRDLKPENILMVGRSDDVTVKLTDFGLAKSVTEEGLKTFCGTPQYFAPEVLRRRHTVAGQGRYGKEADMWSIGVILYILLSGTPPFDVSGSIDVVADAKISFDGSSWYEVSDRARDLVRRLLVTDPTRRLSVVDACEHDWLMQEDGDTHCHPLDDPTLSEEMRSRKKSALHGEGKAKTSSPSSNSNDAIMEVVHQRQSVQQQKQPASHGVEESPAPASKRLHFSDSVCAKKAPASGNAKALLNKKTAGPAQKAQQRKKQQLLPVLRSASKSKRAKQEAGSASKRKSGPRISPKGVDANLAGTPPSSNNMRPKAPQQHLLDTSKTTQDDSTATLSHPRSDVSTCTDATPVERTKGPPLELPDDEIMSDFSDDEKDSIESFGDSNHPSSTILTASKDISASKGGDIPASRASSILSIDSIKEHGPFSGGGLHLKEASTKGTSNATHSTVAAKQAKKVQRTLDGKVAAVQKSSAKSLQRNSSGYSAEAVNEAAGGGSNELGGGKRKWDQCDATGSALGQPTETGKKVQRTLDGRVVAGNEENSREAAVEDAKKPEHHVIDLVNEPESSPNSNADTSTGTNSRGEKQTTLANWFKSKK